MVAGVRLGLATRVAAEHRSTAAAGRAARGRAASVIDNLCAGMCVDREGRAPVLLAGGRGGWGGRSRPPHIILRAEAGGCVCLNWRMGSCKL